MNDAEQAAQRAALEQALVELEAMPERPRPRRPDRYDARALLVPLGTLLGGSGAPPTLPDPHGKAGTASSVVLNDELESAVTRAIAVGERLGNRWHEAVGAELSLACAEHVHAVDPRYLDLPNYDFEYTMRARERLEARLIAAERLDLTLPTGLLGGVRAADDRLRAHLSKEDS